MRGILLLCILSPVFFTAHAQSQVDVRALTAFNLEKKLTQSWSLTAMAAGTFTYDLQELGFAWLDAGVRYKINSHWGVNANARLFFRRNLDNVYNQRYVLLGDLDYTNSFRRWTLTGTARVQSFFYPPLPEGYRRPAVYNRDRLGLRYKLDYYWTFFIESEVFVPLNHPVRKLPDQVRGSFGVSRTFNRNIKLEIYEQLQQVINRAPHNTNILTGVILNYRF